MVADEKEWLEKHIPHRVRACLATHPLRSRYLPAVGLKDPVRASGEATSVEAKIIRRCELAAIGEGRLAAVRWLIEFVGIKGGKRDVGVAHFPGLQKIGVRPTNPVFRLRFGCE